MPVDIDRETISTLIGDELELAIAEFGSSCEVEISDHSLDRAADAVCDHFAEEQAEQDEHLDLVHVLRKKQIELASSATQKLQSGYTSDWLIAYRDQMLADMIKNTLAEVGK